MNATTENRLSNLIAGSVDSAGSVSAREVATKIFFRLRLLLVCVIVVPAVALLITYLVPATYKGTAKVLIRYNRSESSFLGDIVTEDRQVVSAQSNAEIINSVPVCAAVAKSLQLEEADIARPPHKVLIRKIASLVPWPDDDDSEEGAEQLDPYTAMAKDLKKSITVKTLKMQRPVAYVTDELIEVIAKSPNRRKVAAITNRLCEEFIDEYYRLSEDEARRAYEYLTTQVASVAADLVAMRKNAAEPGTGKLPEPGHELNLGESGFGNANTSPLIETMARRVSQMELELARLQEAYKESAPEVIKAKAALQRARSLLTNQESLEAAKELLNLFRDKRRQAFMTLQLYRNRLIPISIIERAVTPRRSSLATVSRYAINGGIGLGVGLAIGLALVMFFGAIDRRLYTSWDVERNTGLAVLSSIPPMTINNSDLRRLEALPLEKAASPLMHVLGRLDAGGEGRGQVILVTSAARNEGKTSLAVQLACALARDSRTRVLLVDGNPAQSDLTELFDHRNSEGLLEALRAPEKMLQAVQSTSIDNLKFIPAGAMGDRQSLGFFKRSLTDALSGIRDQYEVIVVDSAGILVDAGAALLARQADRVILVLRAGTTRREPVLSALAVLEQYGVKPTGAILNCRRLPIPRRLYRKM